MWPQTLILTGSSWDRYEIYSSSCTISPATTLWHEAEQCMAFESYVLYYFAEVHSFRKYVFKSVFKRNRLKISIQWCRNRGDQGDHCPSLIFGRSVNPILTEGGQIMPTNYHATALAPTQSFSPSGITAIMFSFEQICTMKKIWDIKSTYRFWVNSKMVPNFVSLIFILIWMKVGNCRNGALDWIFLNLSLILWTSNHLWMQRLFRKWGVKLISEQCMKATRASEAAAVAYVLHYQYINVLNLSSIFAPQSQFYAVVQCLYHSVVFPKRLTLSHF